jgi:hypothetical protein
MKHHYFSLSWSSQSMPIALKPSQSALLGVVAKQGEAPLTPPYALGENTKRGDWDDLGEHHASRKRTARYQIYHNFIEKRCNFRNEQFNIPLKC